MINARQCAEPRDQQRSRHRREEQTAPPEVPERMPTCGFGHAQIGVDQRDDRRRRENRQSHAVAREPEQRETKEGMAH